MVSPDFCPRISSDVVGGLSRSISGVLTQRGVKGLRAPDGLSEQVQTSAEAEYLWLAFKAQSQTDPKPAAEKPSGDKKADPKTVDAPKPVIVALLSCDYVDTVLKGKTITRPLAEMRKDLNSHVHQASVTVSVELGRATVTMRDAMALEAGDVLVLESTLSQGVSLQVEGRPILPVVPVACDDSYAVKVI